MFVFTTLQNAEHQLKPIYLSSDLPVSFGDLFYTLPCFFDSSDSHPLKSLSNALIYKSIYMHTQSMRCIIWSTYLFGYV